jgi:hypothetical protein
MDVDVVDGADANAVAADAELGEVIGDGEADIAKQIGDLLRAQVEASYPPETRPARRDAHPKAHGVVRAEFRVRDDLPQALRVGAFVPGKTYAAWIRFSNASGDATRADTKGDARGMAIKLVGVPGDKLLPAERAAVTHDFVMINHPAFIVDDPAHYLRFLRGTASPHWYGPLLGLLAVGLRGAWNAYEISSSKIANPLEARYWSTTAYQLGTGSARTAVKYSARPVGGPPVPSTIPPNAGPGFLRDAMIATLAARDVELEFLVQARTSRGMSVEHSTIEWPEARAPFEKVATIAIPKQTFATPARDAFAENLSYTPWHALPEHRPLGAVNRVRRVVYEAISTLRHGMNGVPRVEPTPSDDPDR